MYWPKAWGLNVEGCTAKEPQRLPVTIAVANLYLRKQIIFERV